jgi:spoIIIJ-associated protein
VRSEPAPASAPAPVRPPAPPWIDELVPEAEERAPSPTESAAPVAALPARSREEAEQHAVVLMRELLERMGFQAQISSSYDEQEQEIVIRVESDAEGLLIGRRGQTLDAIEHVLNRMVLAGESATELRLALDVGGYRDRRRDTLLELADRLKVRALTQGRRIQVSPMSPRDRRILQGVLGRDENVRTRVLGTGFYRRVVIFPVGLDEESMPIENDETQGVESEAAAEEEGA